MTPDAAVDWRVADGAALVRDVFAEHLFTEDTITLDAWADQHRHLPRETSSEPGPWRTNRTPYLAQPMQDLSDESTHQEVVLEFGTQLGKSEIGLNWYGYVIDRMPAPLMVIQPTVDLAKRYSKQRVATMLRTTPRLAGKVKDSRSRDSGNTTLVKEFSGGLIVMTGANSAAGLASMPSRFIHADEIDDYPLDVDGQGDPMQVATARQDTFARRKRLITSSPKRPPGFSPINSLRLAGTDFRFEVPCPHCGHHQELVWAEDETKPGLRYRDDDPSTAVYVCSGCGSEIDESAKPTMLARGVWVARNPGAKTRSYHLSSLYSPLGWCSWVRICEEHLEAEVRLRGGDSEKMKAWTNTRLALTYEEESARIDGDWLRGRKGTHSMHIVPSSCLVLTAGVDVQDNRLEASVYGWGPGEECALIDIALIWGDPARTQRSPDGLPTVWERLDAFFEQRYRHDLGGHLAVEGVAVDTGGHNTHAVYDYCRRRAALRLRSGGAEWIRRTYAIKGATVPGVPVKGRARPMDVNWQGKVIKGGVKLWDVGTHAAKDWWHAHLRQTEPGPGFVHLPADLPDQWFDQMASEQRVAVRTARGMSQRWLLRPGKRNEAWDCAVYALFAMQALDLHRYTQAMWDRLMSRIAPVQGNLLDTPQAVLKTSTADGHGEEAAEHPRGPEKTPEPVVKVTAAVQPRPTGRRVLGGSANRA